ncbi:predicted protein [Streptomyces viridochromogenes DSM 40736]|uniref:Predicted protein n=1 Tax=Streptomyces viridochromogenes (strain DSM 40736 / JCM 4977 / BCRC 1201 / Tue 494) TaxID=591159 RepID=D9X794_STRVT|nr:predicted protein [Streptomyces viridochromogenes DSM 40736]
MRSGRSGGPGTRGTGDGRRAPLSTPAGSGPHRQLGGAVPHRRRRAGSGNIGRPVRAGGAASGRRAGRYSVGRWGRPKPCRAGVGRRGGRPLRGDGAVPRRAGQVRTS